MKKILLLSIFLTTLIFPSPLSAHVLETDGSIGAVLHVNPDDSPIIGQPAELYFEIKDRNGLFTPQACQCTLTITENNKNIYTQNLIASSDDTSGLGTEFSFPRQNLYQLKLSGQPLPSNNFQPFELTYTLRVERTATTATTTNSGLSLWISSHIPHLIFSLVILASVIVIIRKHRREVTS